MRRYADRSRKIGADFERRHSGGQGCGRAAARSARRTLEVPWVVGSAEDRIAALIVGKKRGDVGLAHQNAARRIEARRDSAILSCHMVGEWRETGRAAHARRRVAVLQRIGHTVKRAPNLPFRERLVSLPRTRAGSIGVRYYNSIQRSVVPLDLPEMRFQDFRSRNVAPSNSGCDFARSGIDDVLNPAGLLMSCLCHRRSPKSRLPTLEHVAERHLIEVAVPVRCVIQTATNTCAFPKRCVLFSTPLTQTPARLPTCSTERRTAKTSNWIRRALRAGSGPEE